MNVAIVILSIIGILFAVLWSWYKLKDAEEGDLIDIGFGTHVEYSAYVARLILALFIFLFVLLVGLLS